MALRKQKRAAPIKKAATKKSVRKSKSVQKATASKKRGGAKLVDLTVVAQSSFKPSEAFIKKWVNRIALSLQERSAKDKRLKNLKWSGAHLTIAFLDEEPARELNKKFRARDYATDVLSFSDDTEGVIGELAICPQVVLKQSRDHGMSFDEELGYMILHGVLHLLGFDHEESKSEARAMFELQDDVFHELCSDLF